MLIVRRSTVNQLNRGSRMSDVAHVLPVDDLIEHDESEDCACGPTADPVKRDDGSVGWLIIHHSLDGRELQDDNEETL